MMLACLLFFLLTSCGQNAVVYLSYLEDHHRTPVLELIYANRVRYECAVRLDLQREYFRHSFIVMTGETPNESFENQCRRPDHGFGRPWL